MSKATDAQRAMLRHALGLNYTDEPYRNYFAADPDSPDDTFWRGLVAEGYAFYREGTPTRSWPYRYYHVTDKGYLAAKETN